MASSSREPPVLPVQEIQPCQQTQAHSSTPYGPQPQMSQRPSYHSRYSRIQAAKTEGHNDFYTDEDVRRYAPEGLPAAVAEHVHYPNVNLLRRFGHVNNDVMMYLLQQLSCIEDAIDETYAKMGKAPGSKRLTTFSLPFDRRQFISRCLQSPDHLSVLRTPKKKGKKVEEQEEEEEEEEEEELSVQLQNLIANAVRISKEYHEAFLWEHESHKFSPVSHRAHLAHFEILRTAHRLDDEALGPWRAIDDLITPEPDTVYERFEYLLYRGRSWIATGLGYCCRGRRPAGASAAGDTRMEVFGAGFRWSVKLLMGVLSSALVLVPFGLLYLAGLSNAAAFWTVTGFGIVFYVVMVGLELQMSRVLVGLLAYYAVLASILSNLS